MRIKNIFQSRYLPYALSMGLLAIVITAGVVFWPHCPVVQPPVTTGDGRGFAFAATGDFDITEQFSKGLSQIHSSGADFTLALGDFSYGRTTEVQWCNMVASGLGATYPFELIAGNHDDINGSNMARFAECLPNRMPNIIGQYGRQYYFDYNGLARVIAVSPNVTVQGETLNYARGSAPYQWLSDRIDDARKQNIKWVIVAMHENCITPGQKACETGEDLYNLLADKRVDLVLQGHEHSYFRSKQLSTGANCPTISLAYNEKCVANASASGPYQKSQGPVLVINGAGGTALRDAPASNPATQYFASIHALNNSPAFGPSIFSVDGNKIVGKFVDTNGAVQDEFTIAE